MTKKKKYFLTCWILFAIILLITILIFKDSSFQIQNIISKVVLGYVMVSGIIAITANLNKR